MMMPYSIQATKYLKDAHSQLYEIALKRIIQNTSERTDDTNLS